MMNVRGIQRNMKNVVRNYSDAQVKVREATSNDPWGPSSTLMSEIADLTYNVVAFSEIMQMIWKRLNDHGKNWRHVYKALVLLEYLIKTGTEKVAQQCKENIFAIQTLKDFQYIEENKDQGMNVREKSKTLVALLKDDERLKVERARALKAKERFAQSASYMSNSPSTETIPKTSASYHESLSTIENADAPRLTDPRNSSELESARPLTLNEEELQLQLALAMSKEEAEQEERQRKNDDLRLQLAINESQKSSTTKPAKTSAMDDLLTLNLGAASAAPWGGHGVNGSGARNGDPLSPLGAAGGGGGDAFGLPESNTLASNDPWSTNSPSAGAAAAAAVISTKNDPWAPAAGRSASASNDPWEPSPRTTPVSADPWSPSHNDAFNTATSPTNRNHSPIGNCLSSNDIVSSQLNSIRKTPEAFLGPNSNLVNLDALVSTKTSTAGLPTGGNPFAAVPANPFQAVKPPPPTINQLRSQSLFPNQFDANNATAVNVNMNLGNQQPVINMSPVAGGGAGGGLLNHPVNNTVTHPTIINNTINNNPPVMATVGNQHNDPFFAIPPSTHSSVVTMSSTSLTGNNPFAM